MPKRWIVPVMPTASQSRWISPSPTRSTTSPVHALSLTMIIITSASRKVIEKPGVRCWKVPESLSWYLASMVTFWSSASLPSFTALSAAIRIEILRVLAEGTGTAPRRSARCPLVRSFRYQLVWNGSASQRALRRPASSFMALLSQSRHGEGGAPELGRERRALLGGEGHQGWAHRDPGTVAAVAGDHRLERGDHRVALHDAADLVEARLLGVGLRGLPLAVEFGDGPGVHVGGGADAARAASAHVGEQEGLAAREHVEAPGRERVQHRLRVAPVARAVLHAGHDARVGLEQPLDEPERDRHLGHRGDVVDVHAQPPVAHPLDHLREAPEEPVVGDALVVERRQHQHPARAQLHGVRGELHRIGERAAAGARHEPPRIDAARDHAVEQLDLLLGGQRVGLRVRPALRQPHVLRQEPAALAHEALRVGGQVGLERGDDGGEDALDAIGLVGCAHAQRSLACEWDVTVPHRSTESSPGGREPRRRDFTRSRDVLSRLGDPPGPPTPESAEGFAPGTSDAAEADARGDTPMMGRWSCVSVVALSGLLAVAASASAECAWVLWSQVHNPNPGPWTLQTAYPGMKACARALDAREKEAKKATYVTEDGRKMSGIADRRAETDLFQLYGRDASNGGVAWQCFPDTVDPRTARA